MSPPSLLSHPGTEIGTLFIFLFTVSSFCVAIMYCTDLTLINPGKLIGLGRFLFVNIIVEWFTIL